MAEPRAAAARILVEVIDQGRSLSAALPAQNHRLPATERALVQELCYGTLRWYFRLEPVLGKLLSKPLKARDRDVHALLLTGLYQLAYLRVPAHAAVSLTVEAVMALGKGWAKGLVNGVLRQFQRDKTALLATADNDEAAALAHPRWLLQAFKEAWPGDWRRLAEANNARPPMTLRVNLSRRRREDYLQDLLDAGIQAHHVPHAPAAVVLQEPVSVERLPGFSEGMVSVQDAAAQLAAGLLQLVPGQRVLDACAAPGGKTAHMLESVPGLTVDALDKDPERLARVGQSLERLGLNARLLAADAGNPAAWWDGRAYDRILLDAPCSATGVIRRHPDIKLLRRAEDIPALVDEQARLLRALWPLLQRGGILVYATCSVLPAENARQLEHFLAQQPEARQIPPTAAWGREALPGRQILPGEDDMDGFYYACIAKG